MVLKKLLDAGRTDGGERGAPEAEQANDERGGKWGKIVPSHIYNLYSLCLKKDLQYYQL